MFNSEMSLAFASLPLSLDGLPLGHDGPVAAPVQLQDLDLDLLAYVAFFRGLGRVLRLLALGGLGLFTLLPGGLLGSSLGLLVALP